MRKCGRVERFRKQKREEKALMISLDVSVRLNLERGEGGDG